MQIEVLDESWLRWVKDNFDQRSSPEDMTAILLKNGFALNAIRSAMGPLFPAHAYADDGESGSALPDYGAIADVINRSNHKNKFCRISTDLIQMYSIDHFMAVEECQKVIDISKQHLRPSTVTTGDEEKNYRTSTTSDLSLINDEFVQSIDHRIASTLGISEAFSEGIQVQRYEVGQEFKEHVDYFIPGTNAYETFARKNYGQRTWTFMVYLNEGMIGGGTKFRAIDKTFWPKTGMAVLWNNLHPDGKPNANTVHCGLPVEQGFKIIITKWFREVGLGPMFS